MWQDNQVFINKFIINRFILNAIIVNMFIGKHVFRRVYGVGMVVAI